MMMMRRTIIIHNFIYLVLSMTCSKASGRLTVEFYSSHLQELTGELPIGTPLAEGEQAPTFRRRVGTAFSLSVKDNGDDTVRGNI